MMRHRRALVAVALFALGSLSACEQAAETLAPDSGAVRRTLPEPVRPESPFPEPDRLPPLGIVLMIGDGMGYAHLEAARRATGPLTIETLPHQGQLRTESSDSDITDSAAAATALASGVRTNNYVIGLTPAGAPVRTVVRAAVERGMATGLVTTGPIVSATPAAFIAHAAHRSMLDDIGAQMAVSGVDVLLGGGRRHFAASTRADGRDLVGSFRSKGCGYGETQEVLLLAGSKDCLVGLFAPAEMPLAAAGRTPTLAAMAVAALTVVQRNPNGFFLLIEGDDIDKRAHANDGRAVQSEVRAFDEAVAAVLAAVGSRENTLIIVTADHETGGLRVVPNATGTGMTWSTGGHTSAPIPIFATGAGAERFQGSHHLTHVGEVLLGMVDR